MWVCVLGYGQLIKMFPQKEHLRQSISSSFVKLSNKTEK